jgi:hypothetical protein
MFTSVYLRTTDPRTSYVGLLAPDVLWSVLWHSSAYTLLFAIVSGSVHGSLAVFFGLILVMSAGYFARLARSKDIHRVLPRDRAQRLMDTAYFTWYFLG